MLSPEYFKSLLAALEANICDLFRARTATLLRPNTLSWRLIRAAALALSACMGDADKADKFLGGLKVLTK